jgi:ABC-type antimicrobial peptide transport system permease subunit
MTVALVNQTMANAYWPDGRALGGRFQIGRATATVVGIVGDVRHGSVTDPIKTKFYMPYTQFSRASGSTPSGGTLVVKTSGDPMALAGSLRALVRELDPNVPVATVRTMDDVIATALTTPRLTSSVLVVFAVTALLLAAIGVYGLLVYVVAQRSHEIGIRLAIGAHRGQIVNLVAGHGLRLAAGGIILGTALAAVAGQAIASQLYDVTVLDPTTFVVVPVVLLVVAACASVAPAWWATRISPLTVLRR